jgi:hypothetical protein
MKRLLSAGILILLVWSLVDVLLHRLVLAPLYAANPSLWRSFGEMNVAAIYLVILTLIAVFVGAYKILVRPKSLAAGLLLGAFIGLALGMSSGFGTWIHMPIPLPLAWGWFFGGCLKGLVAGAILGSMIREGGSPKTPDQLLVPTNSP